MVVFKYICFRWNVFTSTNVNWWTVCISSHCTTELRLILVLRLFPERLWLVERYIYQQYSYWLFFYGSFQLICISYLNRLLQVIIRPRKSLNWFALLAEWLTAIRLSATNWKWFIWRIIEWLWPKKSSLLPIWVNKFLLLEQKLLAQATWNSWLVVFFFL